VSQLLGNLVKVNKLINRLLLTIFYLLALAGYAIADSLSDADLAASLEDYTKAASIYKSLAEQGNSEAQYKLAIIYRQGVGVTQDINEYIKLCRQSAEHGNSLAQNDLGHAYAEGKLVQKDIKQALHWIEMSALAGQSNAQVTLGWSYMSDYLELPNDYRLAMEWNLKASNQGLGEGAANVGLLHENGWGVPVNYREAANWYIKAINQNASSRQAYFHLARLYDMGNGIEKDLVAAERLYQLIVDSGKNEFSDEANKRLGFIKGWQKLEELKSLDVISYPEKVIPRKGKRSLRDG